MLYDDRRQGRDSVSEYSASRIDIVSALMAVQQREIGHGGRSWTKLTKSFIRGHLSCRFAVDGDGAEALPVDARCAPAVCSPGGRTSTRCEEAGAGTIRADDAAGALWSGVCRPPDRRVTQVGIAAHIARLRAVIGHELLLLPSVSVLPVDGAGRVLLVRHAGHDDG